MLSQIGSPDLPPYLNISERKYIWYFVGNSTKIGRPNMLSSFTNAKLGEHFINQTQINPDAMFNIYKDSIFVLNGRGNVSVNCFRIYMKQSSPVQSQSSSLDSMIFNIHSTLTVVFRIGCLRNRGETPL